MAPLESREENLRGASSIVKYAKTDLDAFFAALKQQCDKVPEFEELVRDAHLAIALSDAGRPLGDNIDPRVAALVEKHRPRA